MAKPSHLSPAVKFYKLKDIQRYCRTKIIAKQVPSLNDVANVKADKIFEKVAGMIDEDNLKPYIGMIEEKLRKKIIQHLIWQQHFYEWHLVMKIRA